MDLAATTMSHANARFAPAPARHSIDGGNNGNRKFPKLPHQRCVVSFNRLAEIETRAVE